MMDWSIIIPILTALLGWLSRHYHVIGPAPSPGPDQEPAHPVLYEILGLLKGLLACIEQGSRPPSDPPATK